MKGNLPPHNPPGLNGIANLHANAPRIFYPNQGAPFTPSPLTNLFMPPAINPNLLMSTLMSNYGGFMNGAGPSQQYIMQQGIQQSMNNGYMGQQIPHPYNNNLQQGGNNMRNFNNKNNYVQNNNRGGYNPHQQRRGGFHGNNKMRRNNMNNDFYQGNNNNNNNNINNNSSNNNNHPHHHHHHNQNNAHLKINSSQPNENHQKKNYPHQNNNNSAPNRFQNNSSYHNRDEEAEDDEFFVPVVKRARDPVMDTPEEIRKWIESRKRNYPTRENIERKRREKQLREELGESTKEELSILEQKLKKKIQLMNAQYDGRAKYKDRQLRELKKFIDDFTKNGVKKPENAPSTPGKVSNFADRGKDSVDTSAQKSNNTAMFDILENFKEEIAEIEHVEGGEELEEGEIPDSTQKNNKNKEETNPITASSTVVNEERKAKAGERFQLLREKKKQKKKEKAQKKRSEMKNENETKKPNVPEGDSAEMIIESLKKKQKLDNDEYKDFFNYKSNNAYHKYRVNTLLTNLTIDEIYKERTVILQILRYFTNENFFQENSEEL